MGCPSNRAEAAWRLRRRLSVQYTPDPAAATRRATPALARCCARTRPRTDRPARSLRRSRAEVPASSPETERMRFGTTAGSFFHAGHAARFSPWGIFGRAEHGPGRDGGDTKCAEDGGGCRRRRLLGGRAASPPGRPPGVMVNAPGTPTRKPSVVATRQTMADKPRVRKSSQRPVSGMPGRAISQTCRAVSIPVNAENRAGCWCTKEERAISSCRRSCTGAPVVSWCPGRTRRRRFSAPWPLVGAPPGFR